MESTAPPLLALTDVSVGFGGLRALAGIDLRVSPGEVVAVIGPNGAGKTTLFNAITGFIPIDSGRIEFLGKRIDGNTPHVIAAKGVRRTFQNGGLCGHLTVLENVLAGLHAETAGNLLALAVGWPSARRAERAAAARARDLLKLMDLTSHADQLASRLSGGQQRMAEILRTIASRPPLLLLDEPAVGLSPPMRSELGRVIRELAGSGIGVLLIEHAIELVMDISDRIAVLNYGQKIADDVPVAIRQNRAVLEAYLGHA
jgi:branched-chain amino acid transport system ATP-binding protein